MRRGRGAEGVVVKTSSGGILGVSAGVLGVRGSGGILSEKHIGRVLRGRDAGGSSGKGMLGELGCWRDAWSEGCRRAAQGKWGRRGAGGKCCRRDAQRQDCLAVRIQKVFQGLGCRKELEVRAA